MRARPEEAIHKSIVAYLRAVLPHDFIVHHARNGGALRGENGRAKAMGTVAGWPDLEILGRDGKGLPFSWFLEVKAQKGRLSDEQRRMHDLIQGLGYPVATVRSLDETRARIKAWGLPSKECVAYRDAAP